MNAISPIRKKAKRGIAPGLSGNFSAWAIRYALHVIVFYSRTYNNNVSADALTRRNVEEIPQRAAGLGFDWDELPESRQIFRMCDQPSSTLKELSHLNRLSSSNSPIIAAD